MIVFTCPQIEVPLREAETCHRDVPVQHAEMPFADTLTRILRPESPRVTCAAHFAPVIRGVHGWWHATPTIRPVTPPDHWQYNRPAGNPLELTPRGFYTRAEQEAWEKVQMLPIYKQQIESMIEVGSCGRSAHCLIQTVGNEGGYDWSTLERAVPGYAA